MQKLPRLPARVLLGTALLLVGCDPPGSGPAHGPAELRLSQLALTLDDGAAEQLSVTVLDRRGRPILRLPAGMEVTWSSADSSVATVAAGLVTARRPGETEVVAVVGSVRATARVTVRQVATRLSPVGDTIRSGVGGEAGTLEVRVVDRHGSGVPGVEVEFAVRSGGGSVEPGRGTSDAQGVVRVTWRLGSGAGSQRVTATAVGRSVPAVTFTVPVVFLLSRLRSDTSVATPFPPYGLWVAGQVTSDSSVLGVRFSVNGGPDSAAQVTAEAPLRWAYRFLVPLPLGANTVRVTAVSSAGHVARWSRVVTVEDFPQRTYSVRFLGGMGGADSDALDVNEAGEVAGWAVRPGGDTTAVAWRAAGVVDLGEGLGPGSRATGIANAGEVVGRFREGQCARSFRWKDGVRTLIDGCGLSAADVNDRGTVLFQQHRLLRDGRMIDYTATLGHPVFSLGDLASVRLNRDDAVLELYWPAGGGCVGGVCGLGPLVTLPPYTRATTTVRLSGGLPADLNDHRDHVGTCCCGSSQQCGGLIYLADGRVYGIHWAHPSGVFTARGGASAINNRRQVVGMAGQLLGGALFPYLWEDGTVFRIVVSGGWVVDRVAEVNDQGVIVGHATNPATGERGAVLLTPAG